MLGKLLLGVTGLWRPGQDFVFIVIPSPLDPAHRDLAGTLHHRWFPSPLKPKKVIDEKNKNKGKGTVIAPQNGL